MGQKKCKRCNGDGKIVEYAGMALEVIKKQCPECKGKGRKSSGKKKGEW